MRFSAIILFLITVAPFNAVTASVSSYFNMSEYRAS